MYLGKRFYCSEIRFSFLNLFVKRFLFVKDICQLFNFRERNMYFWEHFYCSKKIVSIIIFVVLVEHLSFLHLRSKGRKKKPGNNGRGKIITRWEINSWQGKGGDGDFFWRYIFFGGEREWPRLTLLGWIGVEVFFGGSWTRKSKGGRQGKVVGGRYSENN